MHAVCDCATQYRQCEVTQHNTQLQQWEEQPEKTCRKSEVGNSCCYHQEFYLLGLITQQYGDSLS